MDKYNFSDNGEGFKGQGFPGAGFRTEGDGFSENGEGVGQRVSVSYSKFSDEQCRVAVLGYCGATPNGLLHYLAFRAGIEDEAALNSEQSPESLTTEDLVNFQTAIMEWLDSESPAAPPQ